MAAERNPPSIPRAQARSSRVRAHCSATNARASPGARASRWPCACSTCSASCGSSASRWSTTPRSGASTRPTAASTGRPTSSPSPCARASAAPASRDLLGDVVISLDTAAPAGRARGARRRRRGAPAAHPRPAAPARLRPRALGRRGAADVPQATRAAKNARRWRLRQRQRVLLFREAEGGSESTRLPRLAPKLEKPTTDYTDRTDYADLLISDPCNPALSA